MKKLGVLLLMVLALTLVACGGGSDDGKAYTGRWEAQVRSGFSNKTVVYDIKHTGGKDYLINVEIDGVKQAETIPAIYSDNTKTFQFTDGTQAVLDGDAKMYLDGKEFRRIK